MEGESGAEASQAPLTLSGSRLTIQSVRGCWDLSPMHHVGLSGREGPVSSQSAEGSFDRGSLECNPEIPAFPGEEN